MIPQGQTRHILLDTLLVITLGLTACGPSAEELAATFMAETAAAIPTATPQPTATHTPEPTATAVPTETPLPSLTPTPKPVAVVGDQAVSLYEGPGPEYGGAGSADAGEAFDVLGQAYDCEWIKVSSGGVEPSWVPASAVDLNLDCENLAQAEIPPTPAGAVSAPPSSGGDGADSGSTGGSGGTSGSCPGTATGVRVNNKTNENATIAMSGQCSYFFTVPPGNGQRISVVPGQYTITLNFCGQTATIVNAINSSWFIDLKCP